MSKRKKTAAQIRKEVTDLLAKSGYKVTDRERTAGALKAWLEGPKANMKKIHTSIRKVYPTAQYNQGTYYSSPGVFIPGLFEVESQGKSGLFVAVYAGKKADEYAMGLDV